MARNYAVVIEMPIRISSGVLFPKNARMETDDSGDTMWRFSVSNPIGSPLFPGSNKRHFVKFEHVAKLEPHPSSSIENIRLAVYADNMKVRNAVKTVKQAESGWT